MQPKKFSIGNDLYGSATSLPHQTAKRLTQISQSLVSRPLKENNSIYLRTCIDKKRNYHHHLPAVIALFFCVPLPLILFLPNHSSHNPSICSLGSHSLSFHPQIIFITVSSCFVQCSFTNVHFNCFRRKCHVAKKFWPHIELISARHAAALMCACSRSTDLKSLV